MFRKAFPLVLLVAVSSSANAANQLQKVISDLLGASSGASDDPSVARCESVKGQQRTCNVPSGYRAEYVRQLSKTTCTRGRNLFIRSDEVVVAQGCRVELRLVEIAATGTPNTASLASVLADGLRAKLTKPQGEYGSLYEVKILTTKAVPSTASSEQLYEGTASSTWGGRSYPLEYSARVNAGTGQLMNLDYRYQNPNATGAAQWLDGTALDAQARAALTTAIRADYLKRNAGAQVQVVTNVAYKEQAVTRSDYRFSGRYGVSVNDGDWQTYRYTARIFLPRNSVSELETTAQNGCNAMIRPADCR